MNDRSRITAYTELDHVMWTMSERIRDTLADNLVGIYAALSDNSVEQALADVGGKQFSEFKQILSELCVEVLGPIGNEMKRLVAEPQHIDAILRDGADRACKISRPVLEEVMDIVGFVHPLKG